MCHKSHICSVDKDSRPICLRPEQEEVLHYYGGLSDGEVKAYADAVTTWRAYALKEIKRMKKPRYLTERRRSYTSKDSVLTEEELWSHNDRLDETRKDRPNILPAEVYRLDNRHGNLMTYQRLFPQYWGSSLLDLRNASENP